jgi:hypothetical protein
MHFQKLEIHFQNLGNPFPKIENPFAKFLEMHFQKFKIHLQKLKIISEIHGNAFAKSMIFFTVKHFLNAFPKPQNQNAFFFPGLSYQRKNALNSLKLFHLLLKIKYYGYFRVYLIWTSI